jgi:hypothetical protein
VSTTIKDHENKNVLGLENSATIDGTDVILDLEENFKSKSQKWVFIPYGGDTEGKGWFMLKNVLSERFLTAGDSNNLKIRGNLCATKNGNSFQDDFQECPQNTNRITPDKELICYNATTKVDVDKKSNGRV